MIALPTFFVVYVALWSLACVLAVAVAWRRRAAIELLGRPYWRLLLTPWKLATFAVAGLAVTLMAPYTGDPTWDHVDAAFMSVGAFATAPWAVGTLYLASRRRRPLAHAYVAACVWMFSASWSYDAYLVWRDGEYPITWAANIAASSVLYLSAGLLWSLENVPGRGVVFGFMEPAWPAIEPTRALGKLAWFALPFVLLAAGMLVPFLLAR